jgi:hypothetical protein
MTNIIERALWCFRLGSLEGESSPQKNTPKPWAYAKCIHIACLVCHWRAVPPLSDLCSSVAGSLKRANNTGVQSQERIEEARGRENARSQILEKRGRRPGLLLVNTQRCLHKGQAALQRGEPTLDGREAVARGEIELVEELGHLKDLHLNDFGHLAVAPVVLGGPGERGRGHGVRVINTGGIP